MKPILCHTQHKFWMNDAAYPKNEVTSLTKTDIPYWWWTSVFSISGRNRLDAVKIITLLLWQRRGLSKTAFGAVLGWNRPSLEGCRDNDGKNIMGAIKSAFGCLGKSPCVLSPYYVRIVCLLFIEVKALYALTPHYMRIKMFQLDNTYKRRINSASFFSLWNSSSA